MGAHDVAEGDTASPHDRGRRTCPRRNRAGHGRRRMWPAASRGPPGATAASRTESILIGEIKRRRHDDISPAAARATVDPRLVRIKPPTFPTLYRGEPSLLSSPAAGMTQVSHAHWQVRLLRSPQLRPGDAAACQSAQPCPGIGKVRATRGSQPRPGDVAASPNGRAWALRPRAGWWKSIPAAGDYVAPVSERPCCALAFGGPSILVPSRSAAFRRFVVPLHWPDRSLPAREGPAEACPSGRRAAAEAARAISDTPLRSEALVCSCFAQSGVRQVSAPLTGGSASGPATTSGAGRGVSREKILVQNSASLAYPPSPTRPAGRPRPVCRTPSGSPAWPRW